MHTYVNLFLFRHATYLSNCPAPAYLHNFKTCSTLTSSPHTITHPIIFISSSRCSAFHCESGTVVSPRCNHLCSLVSSPPNLSRISCRCTSLHLRPPLFQSILGSQFLPGGSVLSPFHQLAGLRFNFNLSGLLITASLFGKSGL